MDIKPPIAMEPYFKQSHLKLPACGAWLTDLVYRETGRSCELMFMFANLGPGDGGMKAADGVAAALRTKKQGEVMIPVNMHRNRWDEATRRIIYYDSIELSPRGIILDPNKCDDYAFDKVRLDQRTIQIAMYRKSSQIAATELEFPLILPYNISDQDKLRLIFDRLNTRLTTIALRPHWTEHIWKWMQSTGAATQLHSVGQFIGFQVRLDQKQIQRFITREIRAGRMPFSPIEDISGEAEEDAA